MQTRHVVVWLDHSQAHVIHFNRDASEAEHIKAASKPHLHVKAQVNAGSGRTAEDRAYLDEVAAALKSAEAILLVGPASEKTVLYKHLLKHHAPVADKVVSVETVDHPSDGQLLAFARKYFLASDRMRLGV